MWSDFAVPDKQLWLDKLQREASKTLGADVDATTALAWHSPDGITYQPLYSRSAGSTGPALSSWHATRLLQTVALTDPSIQLQLKQAIKHDCRDFAALLEGPAQVENYCKLRVEFPETRWWLRGVCLESQHPTPYAWEIDAAKLSEGKVSHQRLVISTRSVRELGGTVATELWVGLAALVELQRRGALAALTGLGWSTALSPRILLEAAKCGAIRRLWAKFSSAAQLDIPFTIHACQPAFYTARLDQATNLLRSAATTWAACVGGCETLCLEPFEDDPRAHHLARNQLHLMREEGSMQKVLDPLAGAYALEEWSETLARQAWSEMRNVESKGGLNKFIQDGQLTPILEQEALQQANQTDVDKQVLVGVTRYVPVHETVAPGGSPARLASPYEALRESFAERFPGGESAVVLVVGSAAKLSARLDFTRGFLALAGMQPRIVNLDQDPETVTEPLVVLCCSDRDHEAWIPRLLEALKPGQTLLVAGRTQVPGDYLKIYLGAPRIPVLESMLNPTLKAVAP